MLWDSNEINAGEKTKACFVLLPRLYTEPRAVTSAHNLGRCEHLYSCVGVSVMFEEKLMSVRPFNYQCTHSMLIEFNLSPSGKELIEYV